jgi:hypothetical protein
MTLHRTPTHPDPMPAGVLPCAKCGGEGREYRSRYGGNDPDVWDAGPCEACDGSGNQACEYCATGWATHEFKSGGQSYLICDRCIAAIEEDDAAREQVDHGQFGVGA